MGWKRITVFALIACCHACTIPQVEIDACSGKTEGAGCHFSNDRLTLKCGICKPKSGCSLSCAPDGICASTTPETTCTKTATGANGFGIAEPCQDTTIITPASAPTFTAPQVVESSNGALHIELSVETYRLDAGAFKFNVRAYCYQGSCSVPGPTILTYPGDKVTVVLLNKLSSEVDATPTADGEGVNSFRHANVTNLHTHGLHIDPHTDNVVVGVKPGTSRTYNYSIPAGHMPGTHWYHSHVHGSSSLQVMGGLYGMWVIGEAASLPLFTDSAAAVLWAELPPMYAMVSHVSLCSCNPTADPFRIFSYETLRGLTGCTLPMQTEQTAGVSDVLLVNGVRQPVLTVKPAVWHRMEFVNAAVDVFLEVEIRTAVSFGGGGSTACEMRLLSIDGVLLHNGHRASDAVMFAPATRSGVAVRCATEGTYHLQSNPMQRAADHEAQFLQNLITLVVSADGAPGGTTLPTWTDTGVARPHYLRDLRSSSVASTWQISVEQTSVSGGGAWLGVGDDCALTTGGRDSGASDPNTYGSCPHIAFGTPEGTPGKALQNYPYRHVGRMCDLEDVLIHGRGATPHPMHIHANHFQVISYQRNGKEASFAPWGEPGDWRDTIPALTGTLQIRHALDSFGGNIMVHCHFLPHEDMGMMDRFWVGSGSGVPCVASASMGTASYCAVPDEARLDEYPRVAAECAKYRESEGEAITLASKAPATAAPMTKAPPTPASTQTFVQTSTPEPDTLSPDLYLFNTEHGASTSTCLTHIVLILILPTLA